MLPSSNTDKDLSMLLYFKPGACSLASRIILTELDRDFDTVSVDTETGTTSDGEDYRSINPKGYVPALKIAPGVVLTENPAILQYLGDLAPGTGYAPKAGTLERVRLQEWLNFTSSELHKAFGPWFNGRRLEGEELARAEALLFRRIDDVDVALSDGRPYILGTTFTVADSYLFVVLNWSNFIGVDLGRWPTVAAFVARISARPAVLKALTAEGLISDEAA
jgi:glutathione S-transferase